MNSSKHSVNDYGIRMIDCDNNDIEYIEDYNKCYMMLVLDPRKALSIPERFMSCISLSMSSADTKMPLLKKEDIILAGSIHPIVFALAYDKIGKFLYWRDIIMDHCTIGNVFHI